VSELLTEFPAPLNPLAVAPVIFDRVDPGCRLAQEEIFGPVLAVLTAKNLEEGLRLANGTRFGLAAGVWTDCEDEARFAAENLHAGIVHINSYGEDTMDAPFGGVKASGFGKDKSLLAFDSYSILKTMWHRDLP
jgi:acyl-CoA reductase-like NAD-dependent aldehyde dehydrogenase